MRIGIEPNLTNVKNYLEDMGCDVSVMGSSQTDFNSFDAVVITGEGEDVMGIEDTDTDAIIIEASGLTPQEVYEEIQSLESE